MKKAVVYIHGRGGNSGEAAHYIPLFRDSAVIGFDYKAATPWEAIGEFSAFFHALETKYDEITLIANSIGAYYSLLSLGGRTLRKAYLISPIVHLEKLIMDMMGWAGVTEAELAEKGTIETAFGETLSWEYLSWVRAHPIHWLVPTAILYGEKDSLQSHDTVRAFADTVGASLTVMAGGEHWFHTDEQMAFLDTWITQST